MSPDLLPVWQHRLPPLQPRLQLRLRLLPIGRRLQLFKQPSASHDHLPGLFLLLLLLLPLPFLLSLLGLEHVGT